jgi:hypothetical protein
MRHIPASGGMELGPESGPWIDIVPPMPRPEEPVTLEEVEQAISNPLAPLQWVAWRPEFSPLRPDLRDMVGVMGLGSLNVSLRWRKGDGLRALRQVLDHERGAVPPALTMALMAALARPEGQQGGDDAIAVLAFVAGLRTRETSVGAARDAQEHAADEYLAALLTDTLPPLPTDPYSRARVLLLAAQALWQERWAPSCLEAVTEGWRAHRAALEAGEVEPGGASGSTLLNMLAEAHLRLKGQPRVVRIGAVALAVPAEMPPDTPVRNDQGQIQQAMTQLGGFFAARRWLNHLELAAHGISEEAAEFLCGDSIPPAVAHMPPRDHEPVDEALVSGLVRSLVREVTEEAVYVPLGGFRLMLPPDFPLREWGIGGLWVYADPHGMWTALAAGRHTGEVVRWNAADPLRPWLTLHKDLIPLLQAALAALWRDLRVAGEVVVRPRERTLEAWPRRPSNLTDPDEPRVLNLPRKVYLQGELHEWGDDVEREIIRRRGHGVVGHLRRLQSGWRASEESRETAEEYGVILPDGHTFVAPHMRGGRGGDEEPVIIKAKGLASIMMWLKRQ